MKCVCPMGGDRECPDNCIIAIWHGLPDDQKTRERRRPAVEALAKQGYTQEAIARQLGVHHSTISRDLETLCIVHNVKGRGKDTLGRKKSPGRPKRGTAKKFAKARELVRPIIEADQDLNAKDLAKKHGISHDTLERAALAELARKEVLDDPIINSSDLSLTAQQKLEAAVRQHQKRLDGTFERRVLDGIKQRIDEMILPHWKKQIAEAQELYNRRRGLMDKATFNAIRRALHPDSRNSISDKVLAAAFDTFMGLEKFLLNEKNSPTKVGDGLPSSWAEWEKAKQQATAERKTKRQGNRQAVQR